MDGKVLTQHEVGKEYPSGYGGPGVKVIPSTDSLR